MLGLPAPFVPHSASLSPATATQVLSIPVPVSAPPTSLDECLFSIYLVLVPLAVRFSVSSGCARRRSVSTYAAILVPPSLLLNQGAHIQTLGAERVMRKMWPNRSKSQRFRLLVLALSKNVFRLWFCPCIALASYGSSEECGS